MKIAVISPNPQHLQATRAVLEGLGHTTVGLEGGKTRLREVAERDLPDAILVDGMCCDAAELAHVEHVTTHHPAMAVLLLCATTSPEFLILAMRAGVREVLPSPPTPSALQAALGRVEARAGMPGRRGGKLLAFMGCKGGSGATFLATNLGWQLAQERQVLVIDLNLQFGDALSFVHDGRPMATVADVAKDLQRLDASLLAACTVKVSPSYSVLAAPEDLAHALEVRPEQVDALLTVALAQYEYVLLDLGRRLDNLSIQALDRANRIYLVMQSALPDLRNATRLLDAFRTLGYPAERTELILNRFEKGGDIGLEQVQRALGSVRMNTVPNAWREVSACINHGDPLAGTARSSAVVRQLAGLAAALDPRPEPGRGLFDRLLRRA